MLNSTVVQKEKSSNKRWQELRITVALSALMSFSSICVDIYLPAMPAMNKEFHGGIELTISGFLIGFSLGQLFWGPFGDRYGRKLPMALGMILFVIGSVGCALSNSIEQIVVWRVIQALGACAGPVLVRAIIRDRYDREQSARMLSTLIMIMSVAPLVGPLLGGQILRFGTWHNIFWLLSILGSLAFILVFTLPETLPEARRRPTSLLYALKNYIRLLMNGQLMSYALSGTFYYFGVYAFIAGSPFVYIDYFHIKPQYYGFLFGLNVIGMFFANFFNRKLLNRYGSTKLLTFGSVVAGVSGVIIALSAYSHIGGIFSLIVAIFFYFSMNGFVAANSVAGALDKFPNNAGAVSALTGAMKFAGGMLSAAMIGFFSNGTPWTMGWIMGLSGIASMIATLCIVPPKN